MDRKIPKPSFSTRRRFKHFCTAFLLGSVSLYAVKSLYELEPETFSKSSVVLNKDTVDIRDFYDNLSYDLKQKRLVLHKSAREKNQSRQHQRLSD